jgi:FKBP-type peptidyl-prolyl cis-trans isomerase
MRTFVFIFLLVVASSCSRHDEWTTRTGLQVTEIREGEGSMASKGDLVFLLYEASFVGGKTFDVRKDPDSPFRFRFGIDTVLPGLEEGVASMRPGGRRILVMPPDLAYGPEGLNPTVPPDSWVRMDVELVEIEPVPPAPQQWYDGDLEIVATATGLQIVDFEIGEGESPNPGDWVTVHYSAFLDDGSVFDTTYYSGIPVEFRLDDDVIPGLAEGLLTMRVGGRRKLIVPPFLAYGDKGYGRQVPPNATLFYDVLLLDTNAEPSR